MINRSVERDCKIVEEARRLREAGYAIVWLRPGEKRPTRPNWTAESRQPADYRTGDNLGLMTGALSGGLVCVDLDGEKALSMASQFLPPTGMIDGRPGKPASHWWFKVTDIPPGMTSTTCAVKGGPWTRHAAGIDFLGTGAFAVVPPSLYATGEARVWEADGAPATVPMADLWAAVGRLAEACGTAFPEKPDNSGGDSGACGRVAAEPRDLDGETFRRFERAAAYVGAMPDAVEGEGGDRQTYTVACALVEGFDLTPEQAFPILLLYNETKCRPPWKEHDLWHKLESADRNCAGPRGGKVATKVAMGCEALQCCNLAHKGDVKSNEDNGLKKAGKVADVATLRKGPATLKKGTVVATGGGGVWPKRAAWAAYPLIPFGKVTLLEGEPGVNKSTLLLHWAACVTRGLPLVPGADANPSGNVLIAALEDDLECTLAPRLIAAGADMSKVFFLDHVGYDDGSKERLVLPKHAPELLSFVRDNGVRLVALDPIKGFQPDDVDSNSEKMRPSLHAMASVADDSGAAFLGVRHWSKATHDAKNRGAGSITYTAVARSVLVVGNDKFDRPHGRVLAQAKNNLAPLGRSRKFTIRSATEYEQPAVTWGDESNVTADDLALHDPRLNNSGGGLTKMAQAIGFLTAALADGKEVESSALMADAQGRFDISKRTLDQAKKDLGVESRKVTKDGKPVWVWSLPVPNPDLAVLARIGPEDQGCNTESDLQP